MTTVSPTSSASQAQSDNSKLKFADNLEMFLNMLTTQLKNQDPLSPMDSTEFTNQLVQFANVEQQINANSNLEKLIALQQGNQLSTAVGYIGKTAKVETSSIALQDGQADFSYLLPKNAKEVEIVITDMNDKIIKVEVAENLVAGEYQRNWDGKDAGGNKLKDGAYKVKVTGVTADGTKFDVPTAMIGRVTGVSNVDGEVQLTIGGVVTTLDKVVSLNEDHRKDTGTTA